MQNLKGRSLDKVASLTADEIKYILRLSHNLKAQKYNGVVNKPLEGKSVALLFQKDSTRTRCAFEVAAADLGMKTVYLGPTGSQFGYKESTEDTAKVLGRMFDGIQFRGYKQEDVNLLIEHSGVPVWNGLTDEWHPTQVFADLMTLQEQQGMELKGKKLVYLGDARNNMGNSLMIISAKLGMHFVALAPEALFPEKDKVELAKQFAKESGGSVTLETTDFESALKDADAVETDVWVSMGESDWEERIKLLNKYQVNKEVMAMAKPGAVFLHCLPALHDDQTKVGKEMGEKYGSSYPSISKGEFEVTNEVFYSKASRVFDEAENRLHTIKAIMLATIGQ